MVYIDESGIDNRDVYSYGYSKKGQKIYGFRSGKRTIRVSIIAALNAGKILAPFTFEGGCNKKVFESWLENILLPSLSPGQTIILDNASFHKSEKIRNLISTAGCELLYLPPYSPDLNEIEHFWFPIKNEVRKMMNYSKQSFREIVDASVAKMS